MSKQRANELAHRYKRAKGNKKKYFNELYKMLEPYIYRMGIRYSKNTHNRIDYKSIAHEAMLKCLKTYNIDKGNFDTHFGNRIRAEVARESIKFSGGLRLPDNIGKKDVQISEEDKYMMIQGEDAQYIMQKYNMSEAIYDTLCDYYKQSPGNFVDEDVVYKEDLDYYELNEVIDDALSELPPNEKSAVCKYFGLLGEDRMNIPDINSLYKLDVRRVIKDLRDNEVIKSLLEDYYV